MIGFGNCTKKREETNIITALADSRLVKIDPQEEHFFDNILNFYTGNKKINMFLDAVREVKDAQLKAFYKPIYDPSNGSEKNSVIYKKGLKPAIGNSYNWWCELASKMPTVEGRNWNLASEYQYYAFLVYLVNEMVKSGETVAEALKLIVCDSTKIGHYFNAEDSTTGEGCETTGSRCVFKFYDLANTFKILKCSNQETGGFWIAGGNCMSRGDITPLANINFFTMVNYDFKGSVGMLVL